jgi:hypothetical protein
VKARVLVLGLAAALAGVAGGVAHAQPPTPGPTIELSVIHASHTEGAGAIDPKLRDLPQLTSEQPFTRYNVYKLVDRQQFPLVAGKPVSYGLVNGGTLRLSLDGVTQSDSGRRYQLGAQIGRPGKDFLKGLQVTASANQPFFVGGQSYQGGTLFVEMVVRP